MYTPFMIKKTKHFDKVANARICETLKTNVEEIEEYRHLCNYDFAKHFPTLNSRIWSNWIQHDRDFMFSTQGLHILKTRYLFPREPIQYCMLRIAIRLVGDSNYELLKITYNLLSCCILSVSSILAASSYETTVTNAAANDKNHSEFSDYANINISGEACRLFVLTDDYGVNLMNQISYISALLCLGVGVGIDASCIPSRGFTEPGKIRTGFAELCKKLDSCNVMTMHERKPKTTIYVNICYETCLEMFDMKIPAKSPMHNLFFGLFIPDLFMDCVSKNEQWYLFSGETKDHNNKRLSDYYGDAFVVAYDNWVASGLYTRTIAARELMKMIIHSQVLSGSPYIMWSDHINRYNNQSHMGIVKTSNLCAEIVNVTTPKNSSSCTLISCNMALIQDHRIVMNEIYRFLETHQAEPNEVAKQFGPKLADCAKYAYASGYMASVIMNCFMGKDRKCRELGISPMGVQDMAIIKNHNPVEVCAVVSEALYRGAIQASCHIAQTTLCFDRKLPLDINYKDSEFSKGRPQWLLRNAPIISDWHVLQYEMTLGMANSMLTAQAPTATTSLLIDNTESVLLAMDIFTLKESESGRFLSMCYGIMTKYLNDSQDLNNLKTKIDIDAQIDMYRVSAPFIDQSQSVMLTLPLDAKAIFDATVKTWKAKLKTGVYYYNFLQRLATFQTVRNIAPTNQQQTLKCTNNIVAGCDSCAL